MTDILSHYAKEDRPWGRFERFTNNEPTTVKIITVNPEEQFSLQKHSKRSEFWKIIEGDGIVTIDNVESEANVGDEFLIDVNSSHRAKAGPDGMKFLEIAFGLFDEDDIERLEDDYGRV